MRMRPTLSRVCMSLGAAGWCGGGAESGPPGERGRGTVPTLLQVQKIHFLNNCIKMYFFQSLLCGLAENMLMEVLSPHKKISLTYFYLSTSNGHF